MPNKNLLIVLGATAVGKTRLAVRLADVLNGEVISADSRQIFKGMDIGTGKDLSEYLVADKRIPYHLIDIKNAGEKYHVNAFKDDFFQAYQAIIDRKRLPILCGGTGMYIHSLLQKQFYTEVPVDEALRQRLVTLEKKSLQELLNKYPVEFRDKVDYSSSKRLIRGIEIADYLKYNDMKFQDRVSLNPLVIGLYNAVDIRRNKIIKRLKQRLESGLITEVEALLKEGVSKDILIFYGLEYKFVVNYLDGILTYEELVERLGTAICQFAKRQMTFFRKMEKDGIKINWIEASDNFEKIKSEAIDLVRYHFH